MKKILLAVIGCWMAMQINVAAAEWMTDLPKAQAKAKAEKKMVLMDFTGSDWCGWCIKFKREVFDTSEFAEYAKKNLVLVKVDFPRRATQSAALKKANNELKAKYKVGGFPTLVVLDSEGKEIGRQEGYSSGGPKAFIAKLDNWKKKS